MVVMAVGETLRVLCIHLQFLCQALQIIPLVCLYHPVLAEVEGEAEEVRVVVVVVVDWFRLQVIHKVPPDHRVPRFISIIPSSMQLCNPLLLPWPLSL